MTLPQPIRLANPLALLRPLPDDPAETPPDDIQRQFWLLTDRLATVMVALLDRYGDKLEGDEYDLRFILSDAQFVAHRTLQDLFNRVQRGDSDFRRSRQTRQMETSAEYKARAHKQFHDTEKVIGKMLSRLPLDEKRKD